MAAQAAQESSRRQAALLAEQERELQRARKTRELMEGEARRTREANAAAESAKKAAKESRKAGKSGHGEDRDGRPRKRRREASPARKRDRVRTSGAPADSMGDQPPPGPRGPSGPQTFEIPGLSYAYNEGEIPGRRANVLGLATPNFHTRDLVKWMSGQISSATATRALVLERVAAERKRQKRKARKHRKSKSRRKSSSSSRSRSESDSALSSSSSSCIQRPGQ